ncbi:hypothetical protein pb186bvf_004228 [Paramecium bursaria]
MSNRAVMSSPEHKIAIKSERALFNEQRFKAIETEFRALDVDQSGFLSIQEIREHLSKKGCPQDLIQDIFNDLNSNQDQHVSRDEFSHGYLQKENNVRAQIEEEEMNILSKRDLEQRLDLDKGQGQMLIIVLQNGQFDHYKQYQQKQLQVVITANHQTKKSKPSITSDYPVWNEEFKFQIMDDQVEIIFQVIEIDQVETILNSQTITKQLQQDMYLNEKIEFGKLGRIQIQITFFQDYQFYLQQQKENAQQQIQQSYEKAIKLKQKLQYLQVLFGRHDTIMHLSPFKERQQFMPIETNLNNIQIQQLEIQPVQLQQRASETIDSNKKDVEFLYAFNLLILSAREQEIIEVDYEFLRYRQYVMVGLLFLITINLVFGRADFLGLFIILYALPFRQRWNQQQMKLIQYGFLLSLLIDFIWLWYYFGCYANLDQCKAQYGMWVMTWVQVLLTLFCKIGFVYYIRNYS